MADRDIPQTLDGPTSIPTVTAPAPPAADVESRFLGRLSFQDGYPTPETVQTLYDALDYQRAVQVVLRNVAAHVPPDVSRREPLVVSPRSAHDDAASAQGGSGRYRLSGFPR